MKVWTLLLAAHLALAQGGPGVEGSWFGTLDVGAVKLRLNLKVVKGTDGALSAKMDSLDQGAKDLPVTMIRQSGASVECELKPIGGAYAGTIKPDGSEMAGTWKQSGASFPLTFRRVDKVPELARPQAARKPYTYTEEEVTYENKAGGSKLAGTLTAPLGNGPFPAVLLITGSGPQDRDESLMGHKPFFVLSDYLTRNGIAVLRVDDRGVGGSTGETKSATTEDFAGDVLAGVEFLKTRGPKIDPKRIGLIGHSEGGVIAPMVAVRSKDVAFIVLMAGTGVPGEQVLYEQGAAIAKAMGGSPAAIAQNRALQEQMMAISKAEADPAVRQTRLNELKNKLNLPNAAQVGVQFQMAGTPWFRYFLMYDPAATLKKVTCPVLAINGELDLQVLPDQNLPAIEQALKAGANRDYTVVKLPKLNHLFQTAKTGSPAEYAAIEETIAPLALETIGGWIGKHTAR